MEACGFSFSIGLRHRSTALGCVEDVLGIDSLLALQQQHAQVRELVALSSHDEDLTNLLFKIIILRLFVLEARRRICLFLVTAVKILPLLVRKNNVELL